MMLTIGITGGIGSGKTTVCKIFELLNIPVFYADDVAKQLMVTDQVLVKEIKAEFGSEAYFEDGSLNRKHISSIVFTQPQKLEKLNSFVHPSVFRAMDIWVSKQSSLYVLKEAALLFESGSYLKNNFNVLVSAPEKMRITRVMQRDNISAEKVLERIKNQMSEEEKLAKADFLINNDDQEFLITQVLKLHHIFMAKALKRN